MIGLIIIQRDKVPGLVYADPVDGRCRIQYTPSSDDLSNNLEEMLAAAKIAKVMGAKEIFSRHPDAPRYERPEKGPGGAKTDEGVNEPAFQTWLGEVQRLDLSSPDPCTLSSAH